MNPAKGNKRVVGSVISMLELHLIPETVVSDWHILQRFCQYSREVNLIYDFMSIFNRTYWLFMGNWCALAHSDLKKNTSKLTREKILNSIMHGVKTKRQLLN